MTIANKNLKIYTDGACSGNPGKGAYAYIVIDHDRNIVRRITKCFERTTNNRMEIMPLISVLQWLQTDPVQVDTITSYSKIEVISDSEYLVLGVQRMSKWKKNDWFGSNKRKILNIDLWSKIDRLVPFFTSLVLTQIKGHSGDAFNTMVDKFAVEARNNDVGEVDIEYIKYVEHNTKMS